MSISFCREGLLLLGGAEASEKAKKNDKGKGAAGRSHAEVEEGETERSEGFLSLNTFR